MKRNLISIIPRIILVIWAGSFYRVTVNYSTMDGAACQKAVFYEGLFLFFLGTFHVQGREEVNNMEIIKDILAAISGVLNGLPQGLLAMTFGFASVPTALAFIIGAFGNTLTNSVAVISFQAETITVAGTMGKNIRERLSMIFFGALIMLIIGLFGLMEAIIAWIGPVITNGMMAGVGIMLSKVAWDRPSRWNFILN